MPIREIFPRDQPLEVDLGCGKGRFLLARAAARPETNFLGVDRMLKRIRKLDRKIARSGLENARLLRAEAAYAVGNLLPPESVSTMYVFFPDPWPKRRHHRRRLFNPEMIDAVWRSLTPEACVHFSTDHREYFDAVCALFRADARFEEIPAVELDDSEKTDFELLHLNAGLWIGRYSCRKIGRPAGADESRGQE